MTEDLERKIAELSAALAPFADWSNWEWSGEFWPEGDHLVYIAAARRALGWEVDES